MNQLNYTITSELILEKILFIFKIRVRLEKTRATAKCSKKRNRLILIWIANLEKFLAHDL